MMDSQVIKGLNFHAYNSRVKIVAQEERTKRQEHLGDTSFGCSVSYLRGK